MNALLRWLGGDETSGAQKYEQIRRKLISLFHYRGCHVPEELADETIDRTARAIVKPNFHYEGDPIAYFRGVARNVYREWLRDQLRVRTEPISEATLEVPVPVDSPGENDLPQTCLERCLDALPPEKKLLLLRYYRSEKKAKIDGRQLLAEELSIGLNALRIHVFRLRNTLRRCVDKCTAEDEIAFAKET
jgi:DNA-directed RNA polymerase specialized sigma24 family protein